ncbi:hypothetical protein [Roseibium salinum]|uniref:Uncharacterized protein n=1 Tax=Roseibium salinum TaxID=1604349 RepID=A0ABT3QXH3_9HYPH|nr:hypothetical protein [Roseibium sp. DSM 29163]MCX2721541.1 hypothetical protein [Roseibium sp. DSM 29163]MDN3722012.1 hypothetical protein [Roseibium salinum]
MIKGAAKVHEPAVSDEQAETLWWPDFRVVALDNARWQVKLLSAKACDWVRRRTEPPLASDAGKLMITELASLNLLICSARESGLKIEYVGPHQVVRF